MAHAATADVDTEALAKAAADAAIEAAQREADRARYEAMFGGDEEQRRRAANTLEDQRRFDAADLNRRERFEAMSADERKTYLEAQEALTPDERYAPDLLHSEDIAQELLMVYLEKRPIPDKLFSELLGLVKAHNAEPPAADPAAQSAKSRAIKDEADAEARYQKSK